MKEALALLADGNAKVLAGGMSLIPLMKLRLAAPEHLVDMGRVPGSEIDPRSRAASIHIGAMATHYEIESSPLLRAQVPAAGGDGVEYRRRAGAQHGHHRRQHGARRSGGRLSRRAPRSRSPGAHGQRERRAQRGRSSEFLVDAFTTALEPGEIVREIIVPVGARRRGGVLPEDAAAGFGLRHRRRGACACGRPRAR